MVTYFNNLQGELMNLLKELGLVDPVRVKARAFHNLQARLFRLTGVQVVSVRGFAKSTRAVPIEYSDEVSVIFTESPDVELQSEIEKIFFEINLRHRTTMAPILICRKELSSTSA
jgi:hypothetical protein